MVPSLAYWTIPEGVGEPILGLFSAVFCAFRAFFNPINSGNLSWVQKWSKRGWGVNHSGLVQKFIDGILMNTSLDKSKSVFRDPIYPHWILSTRPVETFWNSREVFVVYIVLHAMLAIHWQQNKTFIFLFLFYFNLNLLKMLTIIFSFCSWLQ